MTHELICNRINMTAKRPFSVLKLHNNILYYNILFLINTLKILETLALFKNLNWQKSEIHLKKQKFILVPLYIIKWHN